MLVGQVDHKFPSEPFPVDAVLEMFNAPKGGMILGVNETLLSPDIAEGNTEFGASNPNLETIDGTGRPKIGEPYGLDTGVECAVIMGREDCPNVKLELLTEGDDTHVGEHDAPKEGAEPLATNPEPDSVANPQSADDGGVVKGYADAPMLEEPKDDDLGGSIMEGVEEKGFTGDPKGDGENGAEKPVEANGAVVDAPKAEEAKHGNWERANELVENEEEKGFSDCMPKGGGLTNEEGGDTKSAELKTGVWEANKLAEVEEKGVANDWPNGHAPFGAAKTGEPNIGVVSTPNFGKVKAGF